MYAKYLSYIKTWFFIVFFPLILIFIFNYSIDPLWCFSHNHVYNQRQPAFNERQQKTNRLYFGGAEQYDTLLLGSSRTALINQHDFKKHSVYNYSANVMAPWEYHGWIENAKQIKKKAFDTIIIGMDFFGTARNLEKKWKKEFHDPSTYLSACQAPLYRYKSLISYDTLKFSIKSVQRTFSPTMSDYDRNNVRGTIPLDPMKKARNIQASINEFKISLTEKYVYNEKFTDHLTRIKAANPHTRFIVFTTPVSNIWFENFIKNNKNIDAYKRWLRELVGIFGEIYHFMDINPVTSNLDNFFDAHHLYPESARLIVFNIENPDQCKANTFCKLLTKKNIEQYLSTLFD